MNNLYVLKDGKIINYHEDGKIGEARGMLNYSETDSLNFSSAVSSISVSNYN